MATTERRIQRIIDGGFTRREAEALVAAEDEMLATQQQDPQLAKGQRVVIRGGSGFGGWEGVIASDEIEVYIGAGLGANPGRRVALDGHGVIPFLLSELEPVNGSASHAA